MATKEEIRAWVLDALRKDSAKRTSSMEAPQLSHLESAVKGQLLETGEIPSGPQSHYTDIPECYKTDVREIVWELAYQGIIVPGASSRNASLPFFQVTEWGKKCLEGGEYLPFEVGRYLQRLQQRVQGVDKSILLYLKEALVSFRAGAYLSSAVMTGVASERTLLLLRDAVHTALSAATKPTFEARTKGKTAKQTFDEVWKRLDPVHDAMAGDLGREDVKAELVGNFHIIRVTRNETGHPTGRQISREEAFNLLLLFPQYCEATYSAIAWLAKQKLP